VPTAARKTHTHTAVLKKLVHTTYRFSKTLKRFNEKYQRLINIIEIYYFIFKEILVRIFYPQYIFGLFLKINNTIL